MINIVIFNSVNILDIEYEFKQINKHYLENLINIMKSSKLNTKYTFIYEY